MPKKIPVLQPNERQLVIMVLEAELKQAKVNVNDVNIARTSKTAHQYYVKYLVKTLKKLNPREYYYE